MAARSGDAGGYQHQPVLPKEVLTALNVAADGTYIDGTFGRGGHARKILHHLGDEGRLFTLDTDPAAIAVAREMAAARPDGQFHFAQENFSELAQRCRQWQIHGQVDGILLDLGVSSPQLDDAQRGFSFTRDGPLDMRMNPQTGTSAAQWINQVDETDLANVLYQLGEERASRRIARRIVERRKEQPFERTGDLAEVIAAAAPGGSRDKHPATRSFQAIRIHLNRELDVLKQVLNQAVQVLATGGRLAVISFHSLEDRIVKHFMRDAARTHKVIPGLPQALPLNPTLSLIGKPVKAGPEEIATNPRARSAVLRVAERLERANDEGINPR